MTSLGSVGRHAIVLAMVVMPALVGCAHPSRFPLYPAAGDQFVLFAPAPPPPPSPPLTGTAAQRFDAIVADWQRRLTEAGVPGGALAVVVDGKLAYAAGVGVVGPGDTAAVTTDTLFRLGSDTKMLIAATLLREVEDGRVALDQPVGTYLPWLEGPLAAVTPAMLLSHTAGTWRGGEDNDCPRGPEGLRAYFTAHASTPLWAPPGRLYSYSNAGFALIAAVIAQVENRAFEDVVTERVLRPAGMASATFDPAVASKRDHATGLALETRTTIPLEARDCSLFRAAGGVMASVTDTAHLVEALLADGGGVITPESLAALVADRVGVDGVPDHHYGFGIGASTYKGLRLLSHAGRTSGYGAFIAFVPERRFGVVAVVNANRPPNGVAVRALDALLDLPPGIPVEPPAPPATWPRYAGEYSDAAGALGDVTVTIEGKQLVMTLANGVALPAELDVTFVLGQDGNAEYLVTPIGIARRR